MSDPIVYCDNTGTPILVTPATPLPVDGSGRVQPVSGNVSVLNFPITYPVTGVFWQATQPVSINGAGLATYSYSANAQAFYANPQDVFVIGSVTKTVYVTAFNLSVKDIVAARRQCDFIKRASNTGPTYVGGINAVPYDSTNAAATATVGAYTAAPGATGVAVGNVRSFDISSGILISGGGVMNLNNSVTVIQSSRATRNTLIKLLPGEMLAANFGGVALTAGFQASVFAEWAEE